MWERYVLYLEGARAVSVSPMPPSSVVDGQNPVREDQIAADHLVLGDFPADPEQDRVVGAGAGPAPWGVVQNCLAGQAQADGGHAGAR